MINLGVVLTLLTGVVAACSSSGSDHGQPLVTSSSVATEPTAEAQIWVTVDGHTSASEARSLAPLATSPQVLTGVVRDLHLDGTPEQLGSSISGSVDPQTGYLIVRATGVGAVPIANAAAVQVILFAQREAPADKLTIVRPASLPVLSSSSS